MNLYIAEIKIDDEIEIEAEWGAGRNEDEAKLNIRMRLKTLNDWTEDEALEYVEFVSIWKAEKVDGYRICLEHEKKLED